MTDCMRWIILVALASSVASADDVIEPKVSRKRPSRVAAAWTLGAAGGVAIAGGLATALYAKSLYEEQFANDTCTQRGCTADGYAATQRAIRLGELGTYTTLAGVALLASGVIVYATAPRERVVVTPVATHESAGVSITARF